MINFYVIEDTLDRARDIKISLEKLWKESEIRIFWISPEGKKEEAFSAGMRQVDYDFRKMKGGLQDIISEIKKNSGEFHLLILDLCLNAKEQKNVKQLEACDYIAETAKDIVTDVNGQVKVVAISTIPRISSFWKETLKLDKKDIDNNIIFLSGRSLSGGNDIEEIKVRIEALIKKTIS